MSWNPVLRLALTALLAAAVAGCGKQAGPVNVRIGGGSGKTINAAKPRREPVETVKGHHFYDDEHSIGGAIPRLRLGHLDQRARRRQGYRRVPGRLESD